MRKNVVLSTGKRELISDEYVAKELRYSLSFAKFSLDSLLKLFHKMWQFQHFLCPKQNFRTWYSQNSQESGVFLNTHTPNTLLVLSQSILEMGIWLTANTCKTGLFLGDFFQFQFKLLKDIRHGHHRWMKPISNAQSSEESWDPGNLLV